MSFLLGALITALVAQIVGPLAVAWVDVRRHDEQIHQRDEDLEEWMITRHREWLNRLSELTQQANEAGVVGGGTLPAGRAITGALLLYDYRKELRRARNFVRNVAVEERWSHVLVRKLRRRPFPDLSTPARAERLVDYWSEGTARNALDWTLEDLLKELPQRATSQAREPGAPASPSSPTAPPRPGSQPSGG